MTEPRSPFLRPDWVPAVAPGMRILVTGATGGLGRALVAMLREGSDCVVGAHGSSQGFEPAPGLIPIRRAFEGEADCRAVVDEFTEKAGGIDALVVLSGAIHYTGHWKDITEEQWRREQAINLDQPFFLARAAMERMTAQGSGGRVLLTGTESAIHGGSATSFPYAVAKRGTECMVQGMAREGAAHSILVNGLRFGFIESGFHQRWHSRTPAQMDERAALVPLRRGGHVDEAAALMVWLLSGWSSFMTGQMIPLTGGDWL
jgi:NAD(P)-dependent dehydrogenase (short-subunit alcohol dehydrogenase family)